MKTIVYYKSGRVKEFLGDTLFNALKESYRNWQDSHSSKQFWWAEDGMIALDEIEEIELRQI